MSHIILSAYLFNGLHRSANSWCRSIELNRHCMPVAGLCGKVTRYPFRWIQPFTTSTICVDCFCMLNACYYFYSILFLFLPPPPHPCFSSFPIRAVIYCSSDTWWLLTVQAQLWSREIICEICDGRSVIQTGLILNT